MAAAQEGWREFTSLWKWAKYALAGVSSPKFAHGLHAEVEVEELVPGVVVEFLFMGVVAGGESLGDRGRGVARVDGIFWLQCSKLLNTFLLPWGVLLMYLFH